MDGLGKVLELLYTAADRVTTFQATIHEWVDIAAEEEAWENWRSGENEGRSITAPEPSSHHGQGKDILEMDARFWVRKPSSWRCETALKDGSHAIKINVGDAWWDYSPGEDAVVNQKSGPLYALGPSPIEQTFREMLDPHRIISEIRIERLDSTTIAGRQAFLVTASPRKLPGEQAEVLWPGADVYQLAVDAACGILLRVRAMRKGALLGEDHISDVRINEPIPDDVFTFVPPPGVRVRPFRA